MLISIFKTCERKREETNISFNRKKGFQKLREHSANALAAFKNSNEIQKLFAYPALTLNTNKILKGQF